MKKFISGAIVGALLFVGASVFADSTGLIGQQVQGLFSIEKNGAKIADAVIIKGSAYAPVRAVSEATGSKLTVEGKKIIMGATSTPVTTSTTQDELKATREKIIKEIEQKTGNIQDLEANVIPLYESMAKEMATNGDLGKRAQASADDYKKLVEQRKSELAALQTQLTAIDAQIAATK